MTPPTAAQITASLTAQSLPAPTPLFLAPILTSSSSSSSSSSLTSSSRPLAALTATAKHRLLHTSISTNPSPLQPTSASLPATISNAAIAATALAVDTFVQILDIQDLGRSRWEQIEALEAERKGETTKGREVIRVVPAEPNGGEASQASAQAQLPNGNANVNANAKGPFKLLLQDWKGTTVWAFELKKVERIAMPPALGMGIGCKILLRRGTRVARGTVLLEPACVMVFGGRVEGLDSAWKAEREQRLRREVEAQRGERDG
ncbi:uncharacterized protein L3040_008726 [Drepanopeziza brunnea f. sp. 'multigermtubi']|uniref:uncharacterized protein n=1 Tax=Drepanopeziza brunnea f. sp. 'multigermtubi' TaxID=698441 RepID=UPI00239054B9|nr:hypothetical protein L3040_008726 [Drepanopeziza brunnea f. sp. 'multigermtubi']